jgi:hypothetical protein
LERSAICSPSSNSRTLCAKGDSANWQTKRRRHNRDQRLGVKRKRRAKREGTPSFPLDPTSGIVTTARTKPAA